jgi:hypothetical protein
MSAMAPTPSHLPLVVSLVSESLRLDHMPALQSLVASNVGPALLRPSKDPPVSCARVHAGRIECDVFATWRLACAVCLQLKGTFTADEVARALAADVDDVEVDCQLPMRYHGACAAAPAPEW